MAIINNTLYTGRRTTMVPIRELYTARWIRRRCRYRQFRDMMAKIWARWGLGAALVVWGFHASAPMVKAPGVRRIRSGPAMPGGNISLATHQWHFIKMIAHFWCAPHWGCWRFRVPPPPQCFSAIHLRRERERCRRWRYYADFMLTIHFARLHAIFSDGAKRFRMLI